MWLLCVIFVIAGHSVSADDHPLGNSRFSRKVLRGLSPSFEGKNSNEFDTMLTPDVCHNLPVSRIVPGRDVR